MRCHVVVVAVVPAMVVECVVVQAVATAETYCNHAGH